MELMQEAKRCSDSREEDLLEEEEELAETSHNKESCKQYYPFSSSSSSPSNLWLGMLHHHDHHSPESATPCDSNNSSSGLGLHHHQDAPTNSNSNSALHNNPRRHLHLMDLSLGNKENDVVEANFHGTTTNTNDLIEKEHMFDKAVTPSDVGKLNRLVIPKQHAERYFPLDASTNEKGLLLNFEDRNGKLWRFRYSYWNSSQSYVMTKGWSRFVKEKKLDAGDIVSFQRGLGEMYRHRLYIDWRRRPDHTGIGGGGGLDHHHHPVANSLITPFFVPNQYSIRWGGRLYSVPTAAPRHQPVNYNTYPFQEPQLLLQPQQPQYQQVYSGSSHGGRYNNELNLGSGSLYCLRSTMPGDRNLPARHEGGGSIAPVIIDSVPVAHGKSSACSGITRATDTCGKRLRLFGVNMECSSSSLPSASIPPNLQCPRKSNEEEELEEEEEEEVPICSSSSAAAARFGDQKGETSVLFDLNPSFQYRR